MCSCNGVNNSQSDWRGKGNWIDWNRREKERDREGEKRKGRGRKVERGKMKKEKWRDMTMEALAGSSAPSWSALTTSDLYDNSPVAGIYILYLPEIVKAGFSPTS